MNAFSPVPTLLLLVSITISGAIAQETEELARVTLTKAALASMRPANRSVVQVSPEERNPFAQKVQAPRVVGFETQDSEESRLRAILSNYPISGITVGRSATRVLMGGLPLAAGMDLPELIPNQAEKVKVVSVDQNVIVFGFVEADGEVKDRTLVRSISLAPQVRHMLPTQSPMRGGAPPSGPFGGVLRKNETR